MKDRRKVLALLATSGGSAVAAFAVVQALPHVVGAVFGQHSSQTKSTTSGSGMSGMQMQGGMQSNKGNMGNTVHQQNSLQHMGTVIGSSTMMLNSSMDFKNPADNKVSLLVRLPNGHFVAYEKACTHEQVSVHYDPMTHTLVCPAHGSIFDPAHNGAVLQGPATRPLTQVKVHVNADGTITTG
jgi:Rieske Fe-S protein